MKTFITHDMSVAAFLLMKGRTIIRADKGQPGQRFVFEFDDTDGQCGQVSLDFLSSECSKYDGYLRMLRGMIRNSKNP
tara:strand:+ start:626 stop:859 length:234 start_codon:yes stop_codon:yes gene_type:complete